ncbi:oxidoreductase [Gluconobacter roseus]|nr:hypothetical protein [Gluconobacter roseus]
MRISRADLPCNAALSVSKLWPPKTETDPSKGKPCPNGTNHLTDDYGGSIENRARFLLEITQTAIDVWGKERIDVWLALSGTYSSISDRRCRRGGVWPVFYRDGRSQKR